MKTRIPDEQIRADYEFDKRVSSPATEEEATYMAQVYNKFYIVYCQAAGLSFFIPEACDRKGHFV